MQYSCALCSCRIRRTIASLFRVRKTDRLLLFIVILSGVRLSPLGTVATIGLLYQTRMIDDGDCGATGEMKIGWANQNARRKPDLVPLCSPQIPHDLTRARKRAAAV
jgi:hypothetical protein